MKEHVCFLIHSFSGGGTERVFINLAHKYVTEGYKVTFLVIENNGEYSNQISRAVHIKELVGNGKYKFKSLKVLNPLITFLKLEKPAILISGPTMMNLIAIVSWKIAGIPSIKLVVTEHCSFGWLNSVSYLKRTAVRFGVRYLYRLSAVIVCVSAGLADELRSNFSLPQKKIVTIHNPFDIDLIIEKASEPINYEWFNESAVNIVAMGRLTEQKNFALLIKSFALLKQKFTKISLTIIGEGELREDLKKIAKAHGVENLVVFPGFLHNPFAVISKCDVFVLSSNYEGFGNVIVEAMACGTQVISTDCPSGPSEILSGGKYGILVPVENVVLLASAIEITLTNKPDRSLLIERAYDYDIGKIFAIYKNKLS